MVGIFGFLANPAAIEAEMHLLQEFIPEEAFALLTAQLNTLLRTNESTLGWATLFSIGAALWTARLGVSAMVQGLNTVAGNDLRSGVMQTVMALALTLALVGVALVALGSLVIMPIILAFIPLGPAAESMLTLARWSIALAVVVMGIALLYRFGPNNADRMRWFSPGLALAVVLWAIVSVGFSFYLSNFGNYNEVYGSIGAVIALLMWFYLSAFVVLLGASLNAELRRLDQ